MKKVLVLGMMLSLATLAVNAQQDGGDRIRHHRIAEGYRSGELTRPEMRQLHRNETRYRMEKRKDLRDGHIGPRERHRLNRMKRHDNRQIYRFKHNGRRRVI
ncbi:MAG TPA: hypothetical protein VG870_04690 [Chitinophagaceae bacterium]|nr:hypothetical protein [Chitinophagaceae bacterium]